MQSERIEQSRRAVEHAVRARECAREDYGVDDRGKDWRVTVSYAVNGMRFRESECPTFYSRAMECEDKGRLARTFMYAIIGISEQFALVPA